MSISRHKICFVISNIKLGGAERQFVKIINSLDKNLFDINLLIYSFNGKIPFKINNYITINKINKDNYSQFKFIKVIQSLYYLRNFFYKNKFDLIQTTLFINSTILRLALPNFYKNKVLGTIRTTSYKWWQYFFEYILIKGSYLITNSEFVYQKLLKIKTFNSKIFYIANGFEIVKENIVNIDNKNIRISTVGRFSSEKNQIFLIKAFSELKNNNLKLILFGTKGDEYSKIKKKINSNKLKKNIELVIDENDTSKIYKNIDIFVLPSKYEGFPNTLYEAMINTKICLISEDANLDSHIIDGQNGFVFNLDSTDDLCTKINYISENINSSEINKIRKNAYSYVKDNYSMKSIVQKYTDLYNEIL